MTRPLSPFALSALRCPACRTSVQAEGPDLGCPKCARTFTRTRGGIPILLNESNSLFSAADYPAEGSVPVKAPAIARLFHACLPSISTNLRGHANYRRFAELLLAAQTAPRVLVIGGQIGGMGFEGLTARAEIELVETDVGIGPRTQLICDGHDLPFADGSFDGVVVQAVLEHVVDPHRCVSEIHRVLKPGGVVYAETPFMQQVHLGAYDFTRFTYLGHRRLFRNFEEVESGVQNGPGTALAWAYTYFLTSFSDSGPVRGVIRLFAHWTSFYWKYFDYLTARKSAAFDAASGFYLIARRSDKTLPDRELIKLYKRKPFSS